MARRFRFRLEVVARLRRRAQERQERIVAEKIGQVVRQKQDIETWRTAMLEQYAAQRELEVAGEVDVARLRALQLYVGGLRRAIDSGTAMLARFERELADERAKLAALTAQRKVLDKLRERRWAEHQRQIRREEQALNDEIALRRYPRETSVEMGGKV